MSPVPLSAILIYSSLWNYFLSALRFLFYLAVGALLFGVDVGRADIPAALVIFVLTVVCFMGIGILWAGVVLLIKRGEAVMTAMGYVVLLLSGVFFPVSMLPAWMQPFSAMIPLTYALEGMRFALLKGVGVSDQAGLLVQLSLFAAGLLAAGIAGFNLAVRAAKHSGSLTQY